MWTNEAPLRALIDVEIALAQSQGSLGLIPDGAAKTLTSALANVEIDHALGGRHRKHHASICTLAAPVGGARGTVGGLPTCTGVRRRRTSRIPELLFSSSAPMRCLWLASTRLWRHWWRLRSNIATLLKPAVRMVSTACRSPSDSRSRLGTGRCGDTATALTSRPVSPVNGGQKATPDGGVDQKCETILFCRTVF